MTKVVSFGGLGINDGVTFFSHIRSPYSQPGRDIAMTERSGNWPVATAVGFQARKLELDITIYGATTDSARASLYAAMATDTAAKALVVSNDDGSTQRYLMCLCGPLVEAENEEGTGTHFIAPLVATLDGMWQAVTPTSVAWTAETEETQVVANGGQLDAYPVYTITPTAAKAGGAVYRKHVAISYHSPVAYEQMPVTITPVDTAALIAAGKVASEAHMAVYVNGKEVRRWFSGWNTATTKVWINLDFGPGVVGVYSGFNGAGNTNMGAGDDVHDIILSSDMRAWPTAGVVKIGANEAFTYDGIDRQFGKLLNVRRAYGFSATVHNVGAAVSLVQNDVQLIYGPGVTAKTSYPDDVYPDGTILAYDDRKPVLDLANSDNYVWKYDDVFAEVRNADDLGKFKPRGGRWVGIAPTANVSLALGLDPSGGTKAFHIGIDIDAPRRQNQRGRWSVKLPRGLDSLSYEAYGTFILDSSATSTAWSGRLWGGTATNEKVLVQFPVPNVTAGAQFVRDYSGSITQAVGAGQVLTFDLSGQGQLSLQLDSITLNFETETTFASQGVETQIYRLDATLSNETTGESITVQLPVALNDPLVIDTANYTVVYDDTNQYQAVQRDSVRQYWLRLIPGNNTLKYTEVDVGTVDVDIEFRGRYY